jgi:hypothetical protein
MFHTKKKKATSMIDDLAEGLSGTEPRQPEVITCMEGPNGVAHAKDITDQMNAQRCQQKSYLCFT